MNDRTINDTDLGAVPAPPSEGPGFSRRRLLFGGGAAAAATLLLAACGDDDDEDAAGQAGSGGGGQEAANRDLAVAELAAGLEVLAVNTYQGALDAANANKLGRVPPAVATYVQTALSHHKEHMAAWNGILRGAGRPEVTTPNAQLKPTVDSMFAQVKDVAGAANLALTLEDIASQTYLKAIPTLTGKDAIRKAGEIQVVDHSTSPSSATSWACTPCPRYSRRPTRRCRSGSPQRRRKPAGPRPTTRPAAPASRAFR